MNVSTTLIYLGNERRKIVYHTFDYVLHSKASGNYSSSYGRVFSRIYIPISFLFLVIPSLVAHTSPLFYIGILSIQVLFSLKIWKIRKVFRVDFLFFVEETNFPEFP